jgi:beta-aspartyl-peptidase (threonine type)
VRQDTDSCSNRGGNQIFYEEGLLMPQIKMKVLSRCSSLLVAFGLVTMGAFAVPSNAAEPTTMPTYVIAIHGGAQTIRRDSTPAQHQRYLDGLSASLKAGQAVLAAGGTAVDAVQAAVVVLEDDDHFNAGKGAVYNMAGKHELDACIMDGSTLNSGAVTGITTVKNPIKLCHLIMEKSMEPGNAVFMMGAGAEQFADRYPEIVRVPNSYYDTPWRWEQLQSKLAKMHVALPGTTMPSSPVPDPTIPAIHEVGGSTVGCVALDSHGNLAVATSTGGLTAKAVGRVGDTPLVGCGTYANKFAAVSGTGIGEEFIRHTAARDVAALVETNHMTAQQAAEQVVFHELKPDDGGVIVVDYHGNAALVFNTPGMYRGIADSNGRFHVAVFNDD